MVTKKCPNCGGYFSVQKYTPDYVHQCQNKTEDRERVNLDEYAFRGADQFPFKQTKSQRKDRTHFITGVKKYIDLR